MLYQWYRSLAPKSTTSVAILQRSLRILQRTLHGLCNLQVLRDSARLRAPTSNMRKIFAKSRTEALVLVMVAHQGITVLYFGRDSAEMVIFIPSVSLGLHLVHHASLSTSSNSFSTSQQASLRANVSILESTSQVSPCLDFTKSFVGGLLPRKKHQLNSPERTVLALSENGVSCPKHCASPFYFPKLWCSACYCPVASASDSRLRNDPP
jgi:hypothetical protein